MRLLSKAIAYSNNHFNLPSKLNVMFFFYLRRPFVLHKLQNSYFVIYIPLSSFHRNQKYANTANYTASLNASELSSQWRLFWDPRLLAVHYRLYTLFLFMLLLLLLLLLLCCYNIILTGTQTKISIKEYFQISIYSPFVIISPFTSVLCVNCRTWNSIIQHSKNARFQ